MYHIQYNTTGVFYYRKLQPLKKKVGGPRGGARDVTIQDSALLVLMTSTCQESLTVPLFNFIDRPTCTFLLRIS